jgi:hypothetical protein
MRLTGRSASWESGVNERYRGTFIGPFPPSLAPFLHSVLKISILNSALPTLHADA